MKGLVRGPFVLAGATTFGDPRFPLVNFKPVKELG